MHFIIKRKVLISMLFLAISMLGYISYQQLEYEMFPSAELPMLYVQVTSRTDVTPEYMEEKAIIPIEGVVASLENIELIESTAGKRRGSVYISYEQKTDLKYAELKLNEKILALSHQLPDEFNLSVVKVDFEDQVKVMMGIQVRGSGGLNRVRNIVDQHIIDELENIDGVAAVNVYGGKQKAVNIILNKDACDAYNISPTRIKNILSRSMDTRQYVGVLKESGLRYFVYLNADYKHITQIENLVVGRGNNPVVLKDIAEIYYGDKEEESISRVNGLESVTLAIINDAQANQIDLSHAIRKNIERLNKELAYQQVEIIIQQDVAEIMESNINEIIRLAIIGGLLAVFVLWVFLRNFRLVVLVALAMPISIYSAFNLFYAFNVTINGLTLIGISLAVGMLLDTSVVVLENIYRLRTLGYNSANATIKGLQEVWRSIVAATLTTVAVFVPFVFSSNFLIKLVGRHIGVSIISTLGISLFVSLLLIPMVTYVIMKRSEKKHAEVYKKISLNDKGVRFYLFLLKTALRNPVPIAIGVVVLFFATIVTSLNVTSNSLKELNTNQFSINLTMPSGSTLETTNQTVTKLEEILQKNAEVQDVISKINTEDANLTIILKDDYQKINKRTYSDIEGDIEKAIDEMKINKNADIEIGNSVSASGGNRQGGGGRSGGRGNAGDEMFQKMLGIGENEEYLLVKGQDFDLMVEVANSIQSYLEELDNISRVGVSVRENQPEAHIDFYPVLMNDYNITNTQVLNELNALESEIRTDINFQQGLEEYEIVIKYDEQVENEEKDKNITDLKELPIPDANDENLYGLESFADVFLARGIREINRENQTKLVEINYQFNSDVTESKDLLAFARREIEDIIQVAAIPSGIAIEMVQEESQLKQYKYIFLIAVVLIYMILASVFESFVAPFILLLSIPFAAIGSFFFLSITGNSLFNNNTIMGFLILLGLVVNNGIILIDFINILRKKGYRLQRAIITSGLSRVRPIIITAITTCIAMVPLALGKSEYVKAIGPPFAVTVIGGLLVSTLLTLVYIPMLYNGLEHSLKWIKQLKPGIQIIMAILVASGITLVIIFSEKFIWQLALVLLVIIGIPAILWFVLNSLRKAKANIINKNAELNIKISNLVKVYGRPPKAIRDYIAGQKMIERYFNKTQQSTINASALVWKIPVLLFLVFFTWYYLSSSFWNLVLSIITYSYVLYLIKGLAKSVPSKIIGPIYQIVRILAPAVLLVLYYINWQNIAISIIAAIFWYIVLSIGYYKRKFNNADFSLKNIRKIFRWYAWLVHLIPGVGHKREQFKALRGVSLQIGTGMFGLLGPNGAGKSTMIRIICGIYEQSYGKIFINGIDTQEKREELQGLIGYLPQEFGMYENMSAYSYLDYQAVLKGITNIDVRKERIQNVLNSVHMWDNRNKKIGSFSGGMKQRIGIAQVLLHLPRILVVDEPTAGLDPRERIRFRNLLVELSRSRIVIFSTHIIEDISSSCNTMAVINQGEVLFSGTPKEMTKTASGKVWRFTVGSTDFEEKTKNMMVIHHMRDELNIRVRCISNIKPSDNAIQETPLLEDAYLWLLQQSKKQKAEQNG